MMMFDLYYGVGFSLNKFLFLSLGFGLTMSLFSLVTLRHKFKKLGVNEITEDDLKEERTK